MTRSKKSLSLLGIAALIAILAPTSPSQAQGFCGANCYEYSRIITNQMDGVANNGSAPPFNSYIAPYTGWLGVNGALQPLSGPPSMQPNDNTLMHVSASGGANLGFIQVGIFSGKTCESQIAPSTCAFPSCASSIGAYSVYVETQEGTMASVWNYGGARVDANIFRISRSNGTWYIYDLYNNLIDSFQRSWASGAMYAANEDMAYQRQVDFRPTNAFFGNSSPNTNGAMRLLGARGWEPWDTVLLGQYTFGNTDLGANPPFHQIFYSSFYEWGSY